MRDSKLLLKQYGYELGMGHKNIFWITNLNIILVQKIYELQLPDKINFFVRPTLLHKHKSSKSWTTKRESVIQTDYTKLEGI